MSDFDHVTREFYRRIGKGDFDAVLELLADEITWSIPGPPIIPYAGTYHGKAGVAEFFRILLTHENLTSFVPSEFIVDEASGIVCVLGSETAVAIHTGKTFSTKWAEVFHIRNGLITGFEEHIDTHALVEAYAPSLVNLMVEI